MSTLPRDFRYALRSLRKYPTFTVVAIFTLAVGIGANAAIFSVVRGVLLRELPYGNGDRITLVWGSNPERGWLRFGTSLQDFEDWREESESFEHMAAYWSGQANASGVDRPERVHYALVSPSIFQVLGTGPALGRAFTSEENLPGTDNGVIVSHGFWRGTLGGRADVIGRTVQLDGRPLEIVGVMPPGFAFPDPEVDLWKPFGENPDEFGGRGARWVGTIGALARGVSLEEASAELSAIARRLEAAYPRSNTDWGVFLEPLRDGIVSEARPTLLIIWAAVGLILLIAAANVANLLLARATRRERELAVRAAIGAGRARLIRQLMTESVTLAALGGALGLGLAFVGMPFFKRIAPAGIPRLEGVAIDTTVLAYSAGLVLLTSVLFGALPAWRVTEGALLGPLKEGGRGMAGVRHRRARGALIIAELALSVVVLIGAGLTVRSFGRLLNVDPGIEPEGRLTLRVAPSMAAYPERGSAVAFYDRLIERLDALPGVTSVAAINVLPVIGSSWWTASFWVEGQAAAPGQQPVANTRIVAGDYFETLGISLLRGRAFQESDRAGSQRVAVVDRLAARAYWPDDDPIGRRISFSNPADRTEREPVWYTVVGIVDAVRHNSLDVAPTPLVYMTLSQARFGHFQDWGMSLVMRADGDPSALAGAARKAVAGVAPELPVYQLRSMGQVVAENMERRRFAMTLLTIFAGVALVLAAVGVYGILSYTVAEQTREIGMRMALGAERSRILAWVVRRGMLTASVGLALGAILALAASRFMSGLLYEVSAADPVTFAAVTLLLGSVSLAACILPATRAMRVDPLIALREG